MIHAGAHTLFKSHRHLIDARAWDFLHQCHAAGFDARFVGGCVRDVLISALNNNNDQYQINAQPPITDIDVAINIPPCQLMTWCAQRGITCIPTGLAHGTVTIIYLEQPMQVTSLRTDTSHNGRHAQVTFSRSFKEDAQRRDFTMNGLYADRHGNIYDTVNGYQDIISRCVHFIGEATIRIHEDFLRVYRYFRFCGRFGTHNTHKILKQLPPYASIQHGTSQLSIERVQSELFLLLHTPHAISVLHAMNTYGILADALQRPPSICADRIQNLKYLFTIMTSDITGTFMSHQTKKHHIPCIVIMLCVLCHDEPFADHLFKLSRQQTRKYHALRHYASTPIPNFLESIALHHPEWWLDARILVDTKTDAESNAWRTHHPDVPYVFPLFPLTGKMLYNQGLRGAIIGVMLTHIRRAWIHASFTLSYQECMRICSDLLKEHDHKTKQLVRI